MRGLRKSAADKGNAVRRLPKAELHIHLEGSVDPVSLTSLVESRGKISASEIRALYGFRDFPGFLKAFGRVVELLTLPEDFYAIARSLCARLSAQNVLYAEVTFTPLLHVRRGLDHDRVIGSIVRALRESASVGGVRVNLIYDTVRQWGAEAAEQTVGIALDDRASGVPVVGFGLGGDERSTPAHELKSAFHAAATGGLARYVHAGEADGPQSVWEALEILGAGRIGHGTSALQDPLLLDSLARKGIALDCCPTSNVLTGATDRFENHPLPQFIERGVPVTVGSDDPGFFGVWLEDELARCVSAWNWDHTLLGNLMQNAARYSFLDTPEKTRLAARLSGSDP